MAIIMGCFFWFYLKGLTFLIGEGTFGLMGMTVTQQKQPADWAKWKLVTCDPVWVGSSNLLQQSPHHPSIYLPTTPTSRKATGTTNIPTFDHLAGRHRPFPHPTSYLPGVSIDCSVMYPCWDVTPINGGDCGL